VQWMVLSTVAVWIFGIISNYMLFGPLKLDTISKFFGCFICFGCMYLREKGAGSNFFLFYFIGAQVRLYFHVRLSGNNPSIGSSTP
jgi:hypothetical protein